MFTGMYRERLFEMACFGSFAVIEPGPRPAPLCWRAALANFRVCG
jgi:hypothetical protein